MGTKHIDNLDAENSLILNKVAPSGTSIPNAAANELRLFVGTDLALYSRDESGVVRALVDGPADQTARDAAAAAQATADAALPAVAAAADVNVAGTAIAAALGGKLNTSTLDTDGTMAANSDTKIASQKATRTYVASVLAGVAKNKGALNCSANPNYPVALNGDFYRCSVAGKVGGASGIVVEVADLIMCVADNAGGTQAGVGTSWIVGQANITGITAAGLAMLQAADADAQAALLSAFFLAIDAQAADVDPAGTDIALALAAKLDASTSATLTNKRITPRIGSTTSSATPTINTDNVDRYDLTAQAAAITSFTTNLSGTPTNGQALWISVKGTAARAITWGASFESGAATLPTTTVSTDRLDVLFVWNAVTSKWRCVLTTATSATDATKLPLAGGTMDENAVVTLSNDSKWQQSTPDKGVAGDAGFSIICSVGYEYKFALGYLFILSDGSTTVRKVLYAPAAPTATDDTTLGFTTDTTWEMADGTLYECTDATATAAVWEVVPAVSATDATKLPLAGGVMTGAITNDSVINVNIGNGNTSSGTHATAVGKSNTASGTNSSAVGYSNQATGNYSSAIGLYNSASGTTSSAFGRYNIASGNYSSAFGYANLASATVSSAVGYNNDATGYYSSAVGKSNTATAYQSSAFGYNNDATGSGSSAFGRSNIASGTSSSAVGYLNRANGIDSNAVGFLNGCNNISSIDSVTGVVTYDGGSPTYSTAGVASSMFGVGNQATGAKSSSFGYKNAASSSSSAFGYRNTASGSGSSAVGLYSIASGTSSSTFGYRTTASGSGSSAVGYWSIASANNSLAVGYNNTATGANSSALGYNSIASANNSSAFGYRNTASATNSSAVGRSNTASGAQSSAVGYYNTASGSGSSAVGYQNTASATDSSAVGFFNAATGARSSAVGYQNTASVNYSSAFGYNVQNGTTKATELGQWDSATARNGAIRLHTTGMAALTVQNRATEYEDAAEAQTVTITRSGLTATVSLTAHGYSVGSKITVAGANEVAYNGNFTVTAVGSADAFNYTAASTPSASPATGTVTCAARLGSERDNRLARGMFAIRRDGLAFYLDYNDGGTIKNISLGTAA